MLRRIGLISLPLLLLASPVSAITSKEKMETCKFGADDQKLEGTKRTAFIKKCMGKGNYQPAARKDAMKKKPAAKKTKTSAKPPTPAAPAAPAAAPPDQQKQ